MFDVTADGGAGGQDAAESTLPVLPAALMMVTADAFELNNSTPSKVIDLTTLPHGATLELTLSSSLASSIADSVNELIQRPENDAECAASALTADVIASQALSASGNKINRDVQKDISLALQKLYLYQHPDGGWNWWEFDQTDGDITATVLDALVSTKACGYAVDQQRILRGAAALNKLLVEQQDPNSRASWLYTLSRVGNDDTSTKLQGLYQTRDQLDDYGKASLALGLLSDRKVGDASSAHAVLTEIDHECVQEGRTASWPARQGACPWEDDDVAVTSRVLLALLRGQPTSSLIPGAVRWLMVNRGSGEWYVSAADALAISALSEYLLQTGGSSLHATTTVSLDGQTGSTLSSESMNRSQIITFSPSQLAGHKELEISDSGNGTVYVDTLQQFLIPLEQSKIQQNGIAVDRHYVLAVEDPSVAQELSSGTPITVQLDIDAEAGYRYAQIEDALPAGCEVDDSDNPGTTYPIDYSDGPISFANEGIRDNKVVFSFDNLPKGHTRLSFQLDTEQPGTYTICPATASLNYFPEVRGNSGFAHIVIVDQP